MILKNKKIVTGILIIGIALTGTVFFLKESKGKGSELVKVIHPWRGAIKLSISVTGIVQPQNRLEIKPPMNGRVDRILVKEGLRVKAGQVLAWMSSEERAALIDAARSKGKKAVRYWENAYQQIPLISPISGTVIVRNIEPGQTITTTTAVLVVSDRLIVEADVDETDIGNVKRGQNAVITLDAYPDVVVKAGVSHISYESTTENNVTVYKVDIVPVEVPSVYRSGMSANIEIIQELKEDCLLLPDEIIKSDDKGKFVIIAGKGKDGVVPEKRYIETGVTDKSSVEISKGLSEEDRIIVKGQKRVLQLEESSDHSKNPFMPKRPRRGHGGGPKRP